MPFVIGSLVRARGHEWVVLPGSDAALLKLRPLDGNLAEETAIDAVLDPAEPAIFPPTAPERVDDHRSGRRLRDAMRIRSRAGARPLRYFSRIAVEPPPYQLVALLIALRLDPVRLRIADDVGIGKTTEAALIAREPLDRREIESFTVLRPPHLAEQWHRELRATFYPSAERRP